MVGFLPDAPYDGDNYPLVHQPFRAVFFMLIGLSWTRLTAARGAASALYADAEVQARAAGFPTIACEVNIRPRNALSLLAHRRMGFCAGRDRS